MTREEKATLRAEARRRRRNPRDEEQLDGDQPARADEQQQDEQQQDEEPRREQRTRPKREPLHGAAGEELANAATQARELLRAVRGVDAESVSAIERTQNGWKVSLEVVELRRIPESTDVLASYEVVLDGDGKFLGFSQGRRYHRSQAEVGAGR